MLIKDLFAQDRDIYRKIEKVITYGADAEEHLKAEISEYVLTDALEDELENILERMQSAMDQGGNHEIGVWVSGFYGSGKSSFTKYLGLALDQSITVEGVPFLNLLQDRCNRSTTKALLANVAKRFPATVVFVDLSSESLAGAQMHEVSQTLFYKVLERAGYSKHIKVAQLERKLRTDNKYDEYVDFMEKEAEVPYTQLQGATLLLRAFAPRAAHKIYPTIWQTDTAFDMEESDEIRFDDDVAKEMIEILRESSGKEHIIFICDEAGQYVAAQSKLILDLQGLAQNLKRIGEGKVWLFGTGQQTLTEDDSRAALNSPELFKLNDRFPIAINLQANDIREICYRRLLAKSPEGESKLRTLFSAHGPQLQTHTKLDDAGKLSASFTEDDFVNLYPFLPAHFGLLLHILGQLAKTKGGIGLRSAIKILQEVLIRSDSKSKPAAEENVGWLATASTIFDAMKEDIQRAFPDKYSAYKHIEDRYPNRDMHLAVGKTALILQILKNMPVSAENISGLLQSDVSASFSSAKVIPILDELANDEFVPFGIEGNQYQFLSEKLNEIETQRRELSIGLQAITKAINQSLDQALSPLPKVKVADSLVVTPGLKRRLGGMDQSIVGERQPVQLVVHLVDNPQYDTERDSLIAESRQESQLNTVFLIGRDSHAIRDLAIESCKSMEIARLHGNSAETDIREYCHSQKQRAIQHEEELARLISNAMTDGSLVFQGSHEACTSIHTELEKALHTFLKQAADRVFDCHSKAGVRAETSAAEKFLKTKLEATTADIDPLQLVRTTGGESSINTDHPALVLIQEFIEPRGAVEGKAILSCFTDPPYGWSPDTIRYLVAVMLKASLIKLKRSGHQITTIGDKAIDALKSKPNFNSTHVSLRDERVDMDTLARAAERLTDYIGARVNPLEDAICQAARQYFLGAQSQLGGLAGQLESLKAGGSDDAQQLSSLIADLLASDASTAPNDIGAEQSRLHQLLCQALDTKKAIDDGLGTTVQKLQSAWSTIHCLGDGEPLVSLQQVAQETKDKGSPLLDSPRFFEHVTSLNSLLTELEKAINEAAQSLKKHHHTVIQESQVTLQALSSWDELDHEVAKQYLQSIADLREEVHATPEGLQAAQNNTLSIQNLTAKIRRQVEEHAATRRTQRLQAEQAAAKSAGQKSVQRDVTIPHDLSDLATLESLISELQSLLKDLIEAPNLDINVTLEKENDRGV